MKTTIDIPDTVIMELMDFTHAKTKREAVLKAIGEYNQKQKMIHLAKLLGTFEDFMNREDLKIIRAQD